MKCTRCHKMIKKSEQEAYLNGEVLCQDCWYRKKWVKNQDVANWWRKWIKLAERKKRIL